MTDTTTTAAEARPRPKTSDVVGTALLGAVGLVAVVMGLGYGFLEEGGLIGPGFLPVLTGGFIAVASIAEIARLYFAPKGQSGLGSVADELAAEAKAASAAAHEEAAEADEAEETDTFGRTAKQRSRVVPLIFAIVLGAILLSRVIGLLLALTLMVLLIIVLVEKKPIIPALATTVGALVVAYLIFVQLLGVPVPQGMLGIL